MKISKHLEMICSLETIEVPIDIERGRYDYLFIEAFHIDCSTIDGHDWHPIMDHWRVTPDQAKIIDEIISLIGICPIDDAHENLSKAKRQCELRADHPAIWAAVESQYWSEVNQVNLEMSFR